MRETRKKEGREGEHIQVFSPIMACIFSPGPSASTFNIPSRARVVRVREGPFCENIGSFLSPSLLEQTTSKRGREVFPSFLHLFHGSWKVIAEQVVWKDDVEGTGDDVEVKLWRGREEGDRHIRHRVEEDRGELRSTLTFILRTPPHTTV